MMKFRQKKFAVPAIFSASNLLTGAMVGQGFMQMNQASKQAKEAEEQQEQAMRQQKRENDKLVKALNNIAKNAPQAAPEAGTLVGQSKLFAVPASFFNKATRFGKELINAVGSGVKREKVKSGKKVVDTFGRLGKKGKTVNVHKYNTKESTGLGLVGKATIGMTTGGVLMGTANYLSNKAMSKDAKNIGLLPQNNPNTINQPKQISYSVPGSVMSKAGSYLKKGTKYAFSKKNLKGEAMMAAFGAFPLVGYLGDRMQYKNQVSQQSQKNTNAESNQLPQQRSYAVNIGSIMKPAKAWWKNQTRNWAGWKTITGGMANTSSFGKFGRREIQGYGKRLQNKNNSIWSQKLGKWIEKNPNKANLVGAGVGSAMVGTTFDLGNKVVDKATRKLDKDAYAYENFKNQQIPEQ